ncbi:DNA-directed DNA polymerase [Tanacetum coccineum]
MADQRTMAELLQAPTEGYGDAIVIPAILAENFELKRGLLNLVTSKKFCGFEKEDPHAHIRWFSKITSTIKYKYVPNASIKIMIFSFSIEGETRIWLEKEPPRSILTWEDLQRFDESFYEAWDRFKDLLHACAHHGFTKLHQLDTFYNSLTSADQDSLNAAAGGNLLTKTPKDALTIIENKSKVRTSRNKPVVAKVSTNTSTSGLSPDVAALTDVVKALLLKNTTPPTASVKAVEKSCVTCGGPHPYYQCLAANGNASGYQDNIQAYVSAAAATMLQQNNKLENMLSSYFQMNKSSGSDPLPSNTVVNPKCDLKAITTRSGVSYDGPPIPPPFSSYPKVVEKEPEVTKDPVQPSTKKVQPSDVRTQAPTSEPVNAPKPKPNLPYPSRLNNQKLRERDDHQMMKFLQIFRSLHFNLSFSDALLNMPKFASTFKNLLSNKEKLFELASTPVNENCSTVIQKKFLEKLGDPGKFLIPCNFPEIVECLALSDLGKFHFPADFVVVDYDVDPRVPLILGRPFLKTARALINVYGEELTLRVSDEAITFKVGNTLKYSYNDAESINRIDVINVACEEYSKEVTTIHADVSLPKYDYFYSEGDIRLLEKFLNNDPSSPLPPKEIKTVELKNEKSSIEEPPELKLKDLPSHLEYAFLDGTNKLPVIIAKNLKDKEKEHLIKVLNSHKQAITWKLSDIKGIDLQFCTHKILMEDDFKLAVQHQRRVNLKIHEVIKKEVVKLLDSGLIYPISDSPWVSPVHCVPKKGGMTVIENEDNELIPTRLVTGCRVCIDYRKLNDVTRKYHFPLPFMDQMLERHEGNEYYCFLDGFSGYFQIPIDPCMMAIFHDMIEETMEVFMDDFSVFGDSFTLCLSHLDKMLKRCEDTNLVLNWEKCHFMVKEGIVLGHKISKSKIEVDKAKVDVTAKLPHPTFVKGIRSFLGHIGFYRRFIQDFSKIALSMTRFLEKDTPFFFSKECVESFNILKKKLIEALILVAPDWDLPFEIMCDASDYAVGAVLEKRKTKHF